MRCPLLAVIAAICFNSVSFADEELDERLRAVMVLFEKKQGELTVQIGQLEIENQKLRLEVENLGLRNQGLVAENRSLRKQLGLTPEKQVETAASPRNLEALQSYPVATANEVDTLSKTNVNVASLVELDLLPGVGPVIAQRIVDNRPYLAPDDLLKVRGIGKTSIEILKPLVRVE